MSTNVVHLIRETKSLLTAEKIENGKPIGYVVDIDGSILSRDDMHRAREVYMDSMSGDHYVRITHTEKETLMASDPDELAQGVGEVHGWFKPAPDFTLFGRFGESAPAVEEKEPETPFVPVRRTPAKRQQKKGATRR